MSTRIDVYTSAMHLALAPKNPLGSVVYSSIMLQEKITENIIKSVVSGISVKMFQAYEYAKNYYELQLPSGTTTQDNVLNNDELNKLIALNVSAPYGVICLESGYELYSPKLRVIQFLCIERNYVSNGSIVYGYPGYTNTDTHKVLLNSVVVNGLSATITYDVYIKVYTETMDENNNIIHLDEQWVLDVIPQSETVPVENSFILPTSTPCFYAVYKKLDFLGVLLPTQYTWFNDLTSDLYPELTEPTTKFKGDTFLPVIPIRYNNTDLTHESLKETPLYKTSKKLLKILNMPFEYFGTQLNENPDIGDIDHAYVMFGVDLQTKQSESLQYLNLFFDRIHNLNSYTNYKIAASNSISFLEYGLNLLITYDSVTSDIIEGMANITRIGATTKTITLGLVDTLTLDTKISKTHIRRIIVTNLVTKNFVYEDKFIATSLRSMATDVDNHNLIIPIQYSIVTNDMTMITRNALYTDSALLVINSVVFTKVKWYQTSWFKFVVIIVMIIILIIVTIVSWGSMTKWWVEFCLLVGAGMYAAAAVMVLIPLLTMIAISYTAKWIVTTYGAEWGIIGAIILVAVAVVSQNYEALAEVLAEYLLTTPQFILQMSMALISSANEFLISQAKDIENAYKDFMSVADAARAELKAKQDLLENAYDVDPLLYIAAPRLKTVFHKSPSDMIQRCLGIVENTMYIKSEEISNYCSNKLKLPRNVTEDMYAMNFR